MSFESKLKIAIQPHQFSGDFPGNSPENKFQKFGPIQMDRIENIDLAILLSKMAMQGCFSPDSAGFCNKNFLVSFLETHQKTIQNPMESILVALFDKLFLMLFVFFTILMCLSQFVFW